MSNDYTELDYNQTQAYVGVLSGAVIMISIHNMFVSMIMYKTRQTNTSNILKIIFNFGQIVRTGGAFGQYMTNKRPTLSQCYALLQFTMVGNVIVRLSLSAFLLWRLRQIRNVHSYGLDKWISIILFSARVAIVIPYFIFQRVTLDYVAENDTVICNTMTPTPLPFGITGIALEFLIDAFVTYRLVQILIGANKNAAQISTTNIRNKRSLFTAVMYWNFLRLFVSFVYHITTITDITYDLPEIPSQAIKHPLSIILSYVVTADAEIVRVIEGKETKKGSSTGTDKSLKSIHKYENNDLPKYSPHDQTTSTHSQIEDGKIALVSMKRLSFFEWANVVVGKKLRRNDGDEHGEHEEHEQDKEYDDEEIEEIIDGPSKSSKDDDLEKDLEKDLSQDRRISNLSGTTSVTETSTLDENPDVIIH